MLVLQGHFFLKINRVRVEQKSLTRFGQNSTGFGKNPPGFTKTSLGLGSTGAVTGGSRGEYLS